jgi:hypothetical protein
MKLKYNCMILSMGWEIELQAYQTRTVGHQSWWSSSSLVMQWKQASRQAWNTQIILSVSTWYLMFVQYVTFFCLDKLELHSKRFRSTVYYTAIRLLPLVLQHKSVVHKETLLWSLPPVQVLKEDLLCRRCYRLVE